MSVVGLVAQTDIDTDALAEAFDNDGLDAWTWATAGIVLAVGIVLSRVTKWVVARALQRRIDAALAALLGRLSGSVVVVVALIYALDVLGVAIGPLLGALGIAGVALAFAFRDILENYVAGVLLQLQRPFTYGDEVVIEEQEGAIRDIGSRLVTMVTPDGETVKIPSATVIKSVINNYTERGLRRTTLEIGVAYESDLRRAQRVLEDAVHRAEGVVETPAPEVLVEGFGDSSIDFVVRYWHEPTIAAYWHTRHNVALCVDDAVRQAGIVIPFPHRVVWSADPE